MTLAEYKAQFGVSYRHISRVCDCHPKYMERIGRGEIKPSFDLAVKIEHATNGHVPRDNWYPPRPINMDGVSV
jgi:hypothetical protein